MKNYGLKLDTPKDSDYIFGSFSPFPYQELQSNGDWRDFLPVKEFQNLNAIEPSACVTFTVLNCVETLILRKYGIETNWSDRFLACISGTSSEGNSPRVVCDYLRKQGVVPQELWPFDESIDTFDKFYEDIPETIKDIAKEFNKEWDFGYDMVQNYEEDISRALKTSPLLISVSAWSQNEKGRYYRPQGMIDNHATTMIYERPGEFRQVFDSYDSPHIKDVEWDAIPMQVVRFHIEKRTTPIKPRWWMTDMVVELGVFFKDMILAFFKIFV